MANAIRATHVSAAEAAGLIYVTDSERGITRKRSGAGWSYYASDGTLISDGTQKAGYVYSGDVKSEAGFPQKPLTFIASIPIVDYLERSSGGTADAFLMSSLFEITFTNGVPAVPVLKSLDVSCVVQ